VRVNRDRGGGAALSEYDIPDDRRYTTKDEWVRLEDDRAFIGITDYAQQQLGDIVFVELPEIEETIQAESPFGVIESVKAVSDLFAPVSGLVLEINEALEETPEIVNESCYYEGWLLVAGSVDPAEVEELMDAQQYEKYLVERDD